MLGAIAGDIIGSVHEHAGTKTTDFELFVPGCRFTDDTVLALAVADCLLRDDDYVDTFHRYVAAYPDAGYGAQFLRWAERRDREPYNSWGNGAAMRVPAVAYAFDRLDDVIAQAARCAAVTHNHPEGVRGAGATAAAVFLARTGQSKAAIRRAIEGRFGYDLSTPLEALRPAYGFDVSCQGTVPPAVIAFLASTDYEDAVRQAIALGGDADTLACITGAIAEPFYGGVPAPIAAQALARLDRPLHHVFARFAERYGCCAPRDLDAGTAR